MVKNSWNLYYVRVGKTPSQCISEGICPDCGGELSNYYCIYDIEEELGLDFENEDFEVQLDIQ